MDSECDVVIVGAGLSGLCAAKYLKERNLKVKIIEARDRVGGRTFTKKNAEIGWVDHGGSYVGPTQTKIRRIASEFGVKLVKSYSSGAYIFHSKGKSRRYTGAWPTRNPIIWLDCNNLFRTIDKYCKEIPLDKPWAAPRAQEWDQMTMRQLLDKLCWTREAKEWGVYFVNCNVTSEPHEVSVLWFLWYVASSGGVMNIWEVDDAAQDATFEGGSQQISEKMAALLGDDVHLKSPVVSIEQKDSKVEVKTLGNNTFRAEYVVLAIAPCLVQKITFDPPLSSGYQQLIQRVPMGSCIKTHTYYKRPFWRDQGDSGVTSSCDSFVCNVMDATPRGLNAWCLCGCVYKLLFIADGLSGETISPLRHTLDSTDTELKHPSILGFIQGAQARWASNLTHEERKQSAFTEYETVFENTCAREAVCYEDFDWMKEEYTGGCYTGVMGPGVLTSYGKHLRTPQNRIFFASTETAVHFSGYMDGAVEAGERAAKEILHKMGKIKQSEIWSFTDDDYIPDDFDPPCYSRWEKVAPSVSTLVKVSVFGLGLTISVQLVSYFAIKTVLKTMLKEIKQ